MDHTIWKWIYYFRGIRSYSGGCHKPTIYEQTARAWLFINETKATTQGIQTRKQKVSQFCLSLIELLTASIEKISINQNYSMTGIGNRQIS